MPANVLVVVIDGLRASAIGAYGNTTFATPALDRFAAESFLLDECFSPTVDLEAIYDALWLSRHPARTQKATAPSLPGLFRDRDYTATLITDEPQLSTFAAAADFNDIVALRDDSAANAAIARATEESQTRTARLFGEAADIIGRRLPPTEAAGQPHFFWLHSRGMFGPWDAPLTLQQSLLDEGDPPPVESSSPPDFAIANDADPDAAFRYVCAYAAQVMVLDTCWESFLNSVAATGDQWLIMLLGARGFPLGEHGRIGGIDSRLYTDALHVPWLIRFPDGLGTLARSDRLTSHLDVLPTLIDWLNGGHAMEPSALDGASVLTIASSLRTAWRDALISISSTAHAIRTPAWSLREDIAPAGDGPSNAHLSQLELYVRPDDRWEANDVAKLCPDVVEELRATLEERLARISQS